MPDQYRYYYNSNGRETHVLIQPRSTQVKCNHLWMRRWFIGVEPSYGWDSVCKKCGKTARGVRYAVKRLSMTINLKAAKIVRRLLQETPAHQVAAKMRSFSGGLREVEKLKTRVDNFLGEHDA